MERNRVLWVIFSITLFLVVAAATPACADALSAFKKAWAEAEKLEAGPARNTAQHSALRRLGAAGTVGAARLLVGF